MEADERPEPLPPASQRPAAMFAVNRFCGRNAVDRLSRIPYALAVVGIDKVPEPGIELPDFPNYFTRYHQRGAGDISCLEGIAVLRLPLEKLGLREPGSRQPAAQERPFSDEGGADRG